MINENIKVRNSVKLVTIEDILKASEVLQEIAEETPLEYDAYLSNKYQCDVYLKREDLQMVRSFKIRGAYYAVSQLTPAERSRGVVCASAGNHAQGVALTAKLLGIRATIFMPETTQVQKINQVKYFGENFVTIQLVGETFDDASEAAHIFCDDEGAVFVNAFNDLLLIAGQGTAGSEIYDQFELLDDEPDYIFCPVGGGGLIAGVSAFSKQVSSNTKVIGVEPTGAASMQAALKNGGPISLENMDIFVEGTAIGRVGQNAYNHAIKFVDEYVNIDEGAVCTTMLELNKHSGILTEPAGSLSISALDAYKDQIKGKKIVCIISGGNIDIERLAEIEERSSTYEKSKE